MKKRIFIALDISDEARQKAAAVIKNLRERFPKARVGWDKSEKLHLTLKFLGEINDEQLENLQKAVASASRKISPINLRIAETGVFPSPKNARVLWLGVKGEI